jgi:hypothetical protein
MPDFQMNPNLNPNVIRAIATVRQGEQEQILLERALGRALLGKMQGRSVDLLEVYQGLGGKDPVVQEILGSQVREAFKELPVLPGISAAREVAISDRIGAAAGSKNTELSGNVLTQVDGQALKTLADLGGAEFSAKYKLR